VSGLASRARSNPAECPSTSRRAPVPPPSRGFGGDLTSKFRILGASYSGSRFRLRAFGSRMAVKQPTNRRPNTISAVALRTNRANTAAAAEPGISAGSIGSLAVRTKVPKLARLRRPIASRIRRERLLENFGGREGRGIEGMVPPAPRVHRRSHQPQGRFLEEPHLQFDRSLAYGRKGAMVLRSRWGARGAFAVSAPLHSCRLPAAIQLVAYLSVAAVTAVVIARIEVVGDPAQGSSATFSMGLLAGFVSNRPFVIVAEQSRGKTSSARAIARIIASPFLVLPRKRARHHRSTSKRRAA
jgi:hypothetical protein